MCDYCYSNLGVIYVEGLSGLNFELAPVSCKQTRHNSVLAQGRHLTISIRINFFSPVLLSSQVM